MHITEYQLEQACIESGISFAQAIDGKQAFSAFDSKWRIAKAVGWKTVGNKTTPVVFEMAPITDEQP